MRRTCSAIPTTTSRPTRCRRRRTSCPNGTSCRSTRSCARSPSIMLFIPAKLIGVIAMFGSIVVLFVLPWLDTSPVRSARFRPIYKWFFWLLVIDCVLLGYLGGQPPEGAYVLIGQFGTLYYFVHFLILLPLLGKLERPRPLPTSISEPVLGRAAPATDGDDGMSRLRIVGAAALILAAAVPSRSRPRSPRTPEPIQVELAASTAVRHLRPGRGAAGLPGLPRGLLGLPRPQVRRVPQPRRARLSARTRSRRSPPSITVTDGPERRGRDVRAARPAVGPHPAAVSRTSRRPRAANGGGAAAGPVADHQGARRRHRLRLQPADRLRGAAGGRRGRPKACTTTPTSPATGSPCRRRSATAR